MHKLFTMIKTPTPLLFLSLILLSSIFATFLVAVDSATSPVLDTEGNELRTGTDYYILPVVGGNGGGLTLSTTTSNGTITCPANVVQEQNEVDNGLPLTFSPVDPEEGVIRVATDTNIKFSAVTICAQSTVWRRDDGSAGNYFVTTGGVEGNPGRQTVSNWFRIDEYEGDYKLAFCPMVCDICRVACGDFGVYVDENGTRRLAFSDVPLKVMFKKA